MIEESDIEELESLLISESILLEAVVNVLEKKGILTRDEIESEIATIQDSLDSLE
jgi:ACT domain-containing protein